MLSILALLIGGLPLSLFTCAGCAAINRSVDRSGLRDMVALATGPHAATELLSPIPYTDSASLDALTQARPLQDLLIEPLDVHRRSEKNLIQERLTFTSPLSLRHAESNRATAYVYRHGPLGERPLVLWVPGLFVSDAAFTPINWILDEIFSRGLDVVFYVLPYHMERSPKGMKSGEAMLSTDLSDHLSALAQGLADLRSLSKWLRQQGVSQLGAFGGSTGAGLVLRQLSFEPAYDFVTVFIPMVSWEDVIFSHPLSAPLREHIAQMPHDQAVQVRAAWHAMTANRDSCKINPQRISVIRARWDQVARAGAIKTWCKAWNVHRCRVISRGHSLALFDLDLYRDYGHFLDHDLRALGYKIKP